MSIRRFFWPFRTGLTRRLALINICALIPLLLLSGLLTRELLREIDENHAQAALGLTVRAAEPEIRLIGAAQTLARTLAAIMPGMIATPAACDSMMDMAAREHPDFSLVGYVDPTGRMTCASGGRRYDFAGSELLARMTATRERRITLERRGPVSGMPVLSVPHAVTSAEGQDLGLVIVSVPQHVLRTSGALNYQNHPAEPDALITFDREGQLLTTSVEVGNALQMIPRDFALATLAHQGSASFVGEDFLGVEHSYAVVPLTPELMLMGVWNMDLRSELSTLRASPFLIFALIMISSFSAASLAADRLVIRHVRSLAGAMKAFASGARQSYRSTLHDPPREIAVLAETYDSMTETIQREEAELEDLLREKEFLLREVHHRTGNSMQLIASILRMHIRETADPAQKQMLDHLYGRVMILSTVHLGLYRTSGFHALDVQRLITEVISRVDLLHSGPDRRRSVIADVAPLLLPPQQAVPLALLLSEVLPAFYTAQMTAEAPPIKVSLQLVSPPQAVFSIQGAAAALPRLKGTDGTVPSQIGARLLRNFVRQLDAEMEFISNDDGTLTFVMTFLTREPHGEEDGRALTTG